MSSFGVMALVLAGSAVASGGLIWLLQPLWRHYALAKPNPRSSHKVPTPQGGGIAVVAVTVVATALAATLIPTLHGATGSTSLVLSAALLLAVVGAIDDIFVIEVVPRLLVQTLAVATVIAALPSEARILQALPWWIERLVLLVGGVWFVNLVNFMDGIDWMTVAEMVPLTTGLAIFGLMGELPPHATVVSLALCGAMIGFAPFNRPVARLFLGDVGSLPVGLVVGWLLALLAGNGHLAAALLLPLYYLSDATITIFRRLGNGESIMQAHRQHFYQRAIDNGYTVGQVVGLVLSINIALIMLAVLTMVTSSFALHSMALLLGGGLVGILLFNFNRT